MKELIEYLRNEWAVVSSAPATFFIAATLVSALAYSAARWKYQSIIELLQERLKGKDEQLDGYRERLNLSPAYGSEFSRLSHAELQKESLAFVSNVREWLAKRSEENSRREEQKWRQMTSTRDENEKKRFWDAHSEESIRNSRALNTEFDAQFKVRALVLRDELLARVPHDINRDHVHHMYEHPVNPICMRMVLDDLEKMARLLK